MNDFDYKNMKKMLYHCNVNQVIALSVENRETLQIFTPKEFGVPCVLVPKTWKKEGFFYGAGRVDTKGNFQLDDPTVNIFSVDDIK